VVGSVVMSLTEKTPNCMAGSLWLRVQLLLPNGHESQDIPRSHCER
jgi:hypothetical protein